MAEATPETGAEPVTDQESAIAHVAEMLEPKGLPEQESEEPEATREEPEAEEASSDEEAEGKPEDSEDEELPDTLNGFAEALGMEAADLAGHLKVPVKLDGKVEQVTLAELMRGHHREADYTKKTMELAEQRRQVEAQNKQVLERWQQDLQKLNDSIQSLEGDMEAELSPDRQAQLLEDDPQEYLRVMARQAQVKQRLEQAKTARAEAMQKQQAEQAQAIGAYRTEQQRLLAEAMPEISDPKKLQEFEGDMTTFLSGQGYSAEEIGGFIGGAFDHRHVLMVRNAMRYEQLQKGTKTLPKKLGGLAKVQKPGAVSSKTTDVDKIAAGRNRLAQLRSRGTKQQQTDAAVKYVKGLL